MAAMVRKLALAVVSLGLLVGGCGGSDKTNLEDYDGSAPTGGTSSGGASTGGATTGGTNMGGGGAANTAGASPGGGGALGGGGGLGGAGGRGGASGAGGGTVDLCREAGDKIDAEAVALGCASNNSAKVQSDCEAHLANTPDCADELALFMTCVLAAPAADWACNAQGQPDLASSDCATEESALGACWDRIVCGVPGDCPDPNNPCVLSTCDNAACGTSNVATGTPVGNQVPNDCGLAVCDNGTTTTVLDSTDILDDGNPCTDDTCTTNGPRNTPSNAGTPCGTTGYKCDGGGRCVQCLTLTDCAAGVCNALNQCVPSTCNDGVKAGDETDVDCGGSCGATCAPGHACAAATDCASGVCAASTCAVPACDDRVKNGIETAIDCGGGCAGCGPNAACKVDSDCVGNQCSGATCVPNCSDAVKNDGESDTDCGGPNCAKCSDGRACAIGTDCAGGACIGGVCIDSCGNGIKDGTESDVDCGGICRTCASGKRCGSGTDCTSVLCADGVCCNTACTGSCQACTAVRKGGGSDGTCGPIKAGTDPDGECIDEGAASCGTTGVCNGSGACERYPDGTICVQGSCSKGTQTNPDQCSGGACSDKGTTDCSPYVCGGISCKLSCSSDSDCVSIDYCSGSACVAKKGTGSTCTANNECSSAFCVDGYCCNNACSGTCQACSAALKASGTNNGTCGNAKSGVSTGDCTTDSPNTCGQDGTCDGKGGCRLYQGGTLCGSQVCGSVIGSGVCGTSTECWVSPECNGTGSCVNKVLSCDPYVCGGSGQNPPNACGTTCTQDGDCSTSNCNTATGQCEPKKDDGSGCSAAWQCKSSSCVDGVCCDKPCTNGCQACTASKKGAGADGQCGAIVAGSDPNDVCIDATVTGDPCGTDGSCDGNGACELVASGTECTAQMCDSGPNQQINAYTCDGNGGCMDNGIVSCGAYLCSGSACLKSCTSGADCYSGFYCDGAKCQPKKPNGDPCTTNDECSGGGCNRLGECTWTMCVNGVKEPSESDIDCGGPDCGATCDTDQLCQSVSDCAPPNTKCTGNPPTCQP